MLFKPDIRLDRITDITADLLEKQGIKGLMLDVDNTLTTAHGTGILKDGAGEWIEKMTQSGIKLTVLSNAKKPRIAPFAEKIGLPFTALAAKPLPFGYLRAAGAMGLKRKQTAIVGDQIFTDMLGGHLAGVKTILVTDIVPERKTSFKIRRHFEKLLLKHYKF